MIRERRNFLDIARGIAIWFIVLGHTDWASDSIMSWGNAVLSSFFVISGILLPYACQKDMSIKEFIGNRSRRLLFPYFTFSIIYLVFMSLFAILTEGTNAVEGILKNVISVCTFNGLLVTWYFPVAFAAEVIVFVIIKKFSRKILVPAIVISAILTGAFSFVSAAVLEKKETSLLYYVLICLLMFVVRCIIAVVFVGVGFLVSARIMKEEHNRLVLVVGTIVSLALAIIIGLHQDVTYIDECKMGNPLLFYLGFIVMSMGIIGLSMIIGKNKILEYFGKNSLVVMLTHIPIPVMISGILYGIISSIVPDISLLVVIIPLTIILMLCEVPIIKIVNKYLRFLIIRERKG